MKEGVRYLVLLGAACSGANAFVAPVAPPLARLPLASGAAAARPLRLRSAASVLSMQDAKLDKRAERRRIVA